MIFGYVFFALLFVTGIVGYWWSSQELSEVATWSQLEYRAQKQDKVAGEAPVD